MPIPDKHTKDNKEIRLFGEKSLREEAYRQKIIELEKEVMKLEVILKGERKSDEEVTIENRQQGIIAESSVSLDEKAKNYLHALEVKARNISERLNSEMQSLIWQKRVPAPVDVNKNIFVLVSLSILLVMAMAISGIFVFFKLSKMAFQG